MSKSSVNVRGSQQMMKMMSVRGRWYMVLKHQLCLSKMVLHTYMYMKAVHHHLSRVAHHHLSVILSDLLL
jgi:hypothetical protein